MAQSKEQSPELTLKKQIYELPDKELRIILLSSVYYQRTQKQYMNKISTEIETIEEKKRF